MIIRARAVVPMTPAAFRAAPVLFDGAILIAGGRIEAVGPWEEIRRRAEAGGNGNGGGELIDLGESIILPGLINAHCHLDYTMLRGVIPPPAELSEPSFAAWVGEINRHKAAFSEGEIRDAIRAGFSELKAHGTTTVCNLTAYPGLIGSLLPAPIRTWWFPELIDIRNPGEPAEEALLAQLASLLGGVEARLAGDPLSHLGLCPHAPYTASPALYRRLPAVAAKHGMSLSTHLAESADEEAMFARASGPLYTFLEKIGRPMDDCGHDSSFGNAVDGGLVGPGWLLAHVNELGEKDFQRLAEDGPEWHIVHCPRSHAYFGHTPFPWERLESLGAGISLGTDSLASNTSLDLFAEMRAVAKAIPSISPESLLESVTTRPAKALGQEGRLGAILPGACADLIAIPIHGSLGGREESAAAVQAMIINHRGPAPWMMLEGKLC